MSKESMVEFASLVAHAVVDALEKKHIIGGNNNNANAKVDKHDKHDKQEKSAYQKTEQLLYNYNGFKRIIKERELEIEEVLKYGVPQNNSVKEFVGRSGVPGGIRLEEETVEAYVANVQRSVADTVQAIALIDKCMDGLKTDPYYDILPMRYFEGRTQEDIADYYGVSQVSISKNKNRLVKELSIRLFPNQSINEMLS